MTWSKTFKCIGWLGSQVAFEGKKARLSWLMGVCVFWMHEWLQREGATYTDRKRVLCTRKNVIDERNRIFTQTHTITQSLIHSLYRTTPNIYCRKEKFTNDVIRFLPQLFFVLASSSRLFVQSAELEAKVLFIVFSRCWIITPSAKNLL